MEMVKASARACRECGAPLPARIGPGRPRILCDSCRRPQTSTPAPPIWDGPVLAALDRSYSDSDNPVALALARNLAARLDGCPDGAVTSIRLLSGALEKVLPAIDQHGRGEPNPRDELALRRQRRS